MIDPAASEILQIRGPEVDFLDEFLKGLAKAATPNNPAGTAEFYVVAEEQARSVSSPGARLVMAAAGLGLAHDVRTANRFYNILRNAPEIKDDEDLVERLNLLAIQASLDREHNKAAAAVMRELPQRVDAPAIDTLHALGSLTLLAYIAGFTAGTEAYEAIANNLHVAFSKYAGIAELQDAQNLPDTQK